MEPNNPSEGQGPTCTAERLRRRIEALERLKGDVDQRRDQVDQLIVLAEQRLERCLEEGAVTDDNRPHAGH